MVVIVNIIEYYTIGQLTIAGTMVVIVNIQEYYTLGQLPIAGTMAVIVNNNSEQGSEVRLVE